MKRPGHAKVLLKLHESKKPMSMGELRHSLRDMGKQELSESLDYLHKTDRVEMRADGKVVLRR